ncbi:hypothetical protein ACJMK2_023900 [Sinanodonta woodiana]|uniref:LRAT domain-containing protein n=1 Tax=Sinanodonta woodiana TaxID=1069815 RepID=A0ABD3T6N0_SINWO
MASSESLEYGIESEIISDYRSLTRGDQIAIEGNIVDEDYYHHGIYLGDGIVADFGGDGKKGTKPRTVSIAEVTGHGKRKLFRINYKFGQCLSNEEAASNAEDLVKKPNHWGSYHLLRNNCEHFATRCKTGIATSKQVIKKVHDCIKSPTKLIKYILLLTVAGSRLASGSISS